MFFRIKPLSYPALSALPSDLTQRVVKSIFFDAIPRLSRVFPFFSLITTSVFVTTPIEPDFTVWMLIGTFQSAPLASFSNCVPFTVIDSICV